MSLPNSLSVSLKRFQQAVSTTQRITADRTSVKSAGQITFQLPRSGVIDLQSISLLANMTITGTGTIVTNPYHSMMFRRVEFQIGSTTVSLQNLGDYGLAYYVAMVYASNRLRSDYMQGVGLEGNVTLTSATASPVTLASNWLGMLSGKHLRYLPMDILPECQLVIYLHDQSRWASATTITDATLDNIRLIFQRLDFEGNLISQLWADRISKSPIVIPIDNVSYYEGASTTASSSFSAYVNGQSVDYVFALARPADYDTSFANRWVLNGFNLGASTEATKNNTLLQLSVNGAPVSSFQLNPIDTLVSTCFALGGSGNALYQPDFGTVAYGSSTFANYRDTYFAYVHRLRCETDDVDGKGWVTGMNTYGQSVEVNINYTIDSSATTAKKPVLIVFSTATIEVGAGKQIAVAL